MGFDEVSNEWREQWPSIHLRAECIASILETCNYTSLCTCAGVYDKSEEADWPPRTYAEGVIWADDFM